MLLPDCASALLTAVQDCRLQKALAQRRCTTLRQLHTSTAWAQSSPFCALVKCTNTTQHCTVSRFDRSLSRHRCLPDAQVDADAPSAKILPSIITEECVLPVADESAASYLELSRVTRIANSRNSPHALSLVPPGIASGKAHEDVHVAHES